MAEVTYDSATCIYPGADRPAVDAKQGTDIPDRAPLLIDRRVPARPEAVSSSTGHGANAALSLLSGSFT